MNPRFTITNKMTAGLTRIERARGFLDAAQLSEEWLAAMRSRAFLLEAHHTTHIEGTRLTIEQAEQLLAGKSVTEADPDDTRELLNYRDAFEFVSSYLHDGGPVTESLIREIHRRLVEGVRGGSAASGEYRRVQNYVANSRTGEIIYTPPSPMEVPPLMAELSAWLNSEHEIHPALIAGIAQFQLVHIHPFVDGNGRTSRLLSTLCLYRAGYDFKRLFSISEFYDRDRTAFYSAIQSVRERGMDLTSWLDYFVEGLATQMAEITERGKQTIKSEILAKQHGLNQRQTAALRYLMEHGKITIQDYEALYPEVNRRSLQRDLKQMLDKG
ncbi:MAG: Fic family protein, partial [Blastocatellia bacterium]